MEDSCRRYYSDWAFISSGALKVIAAGSMIIDHIGFALFPKITILRIIGRISFPIYCFLLAESARYTGNIRRFLFKLGIFALISEIPFNLALEEGQLHPPPECVFHLVSRGCDDRTVAETAAVITRTGR